MTAQGATSAFLDGETAAALDIARDLARHGVPIFLARPALDAAGRWQPDGGSGGTGYVLPRDWQNSTADEKALDSWQPGMAVAAVGGHGVDFGDVDPRHGGDESKTQLQAAGLWPNVLGSQTTPSGGHHDLVNALGVASRDDLQPGIDIKAGAPDGTGRGFVFIAPTLRLSKTNVIRGYRWITPPMLEELNAGDDSGSALAGMIGRLRCHSVPAPDAPHGAYDLMAPGQQRRVSGYLASVVAAEAATFADVATWPVGHRDERRRGWQKRTADLCLRLGQLARADWTPWTSEQAWRHAQAVVPSVIGEAVGLAQTYAAQSGRCLPALYPATLADEQGPADAFGYTETKPETKTKAKPEAKAKAEDKPPPAVRVAEYALKRYEPHLSPDGEPFAVPLHGPRLLIPLGEKGGSLRARVAGELYRATGEVFGAEAISAGVGILRSDALNLTTHTPIHLRVASTTSRMVIDLGQPNNTRCVVIDGAGWNIYDEPPPGLLFRRPASLRPLPDPVRGGSLDPLRVLLGFTAQDRRWQLVRGWLVASTLGDIPRPLLILLGPAGSGKTSRGLLIINVLDPRGELGSSFGRNADDDQVKALSRFLVGYDNLTSLSEAVMGHLCRLVTGESAEKRKNYSDTETIVVSYKRTGVLTAITLPQLRADTLDRLIPLHLDPMPPGARSSEMRLHATFTDAHPSILGAVCDGAAAMLSRLPQLVDEDASGPRNMDYSLALQAYDPACAAAYQEAADDVLVTAAEDDPFVVTVRDWLLCWAKSTGQRERVNEPAEAFASVTHYARSRDDFASTWWPVKPKTFTQSMTRAAGPLAAVGVTFRAGQTMGRRVWRFELGEEAAR